MFLATATVRNVEEECLVKLVCGSYGTKVHRLLADADLAPRLLGTQTLEGAPTAIAMEYLQPYSPGSEGWATLFSLANDMEPDMRRSVVLEMVGIIKKLEEANLVHGDLRLNNVMVHVNADGTIGKVHIKIIDFDWSGESGTVTYPIWRNDQILNWPAGIGEAIVTGYDHTWVKQWWGEAFPNEVYPPVG
jgi:serine/threonine protein kinase